MSKKTPYVKQKRVTTHLSRTAPLVAAGYSVKVKSYKGQPVPLSAHTNIVEERSNHPVSGKELSKPREYHVAPESTHLSQRDEMKQGYEAHKAAEDGARHAPKSEGHTGGDEYNRDDHGQFTGGKS